MRRADGAELLTLSENDNGIVEIQFAAADGAKRVLRGEPRDTGKRKYRVGDSAVMFEVKPGDDDGFKLRTADGKLRWKVKISIDKVKISDNEQNANPFELKLKESDRSKVVAPGDRELGKVRYDATVSKIEDATGKPLFDASKKSAAFGVLLIDGIPELERYILIAELLSRGK